MLGYQFAVRQPPISQLQNHVFHLLDFRHPIVVLSSRQFRQVAMCMFSTEPVKIAYNCGLYLCPELFNAVGGHIPFDVNSITVVYGPVFERNALPQLAFIRA